VPVLVARPVALAAVLAGEGGVERGARRSVDALRLCTCDGHKHNDTRHE
jgi:hypothetical protein